jgi:hypothetical protein
MTVNHWVAGSSPAGGATTNSEQLERLHKHAAFFVRQKHTSGIDLQLT